MSKICDHKMKIIHLYLQYIPLYVSLGKCSTFPSTAIVYRWENRQRFNLFFCLIMQTEHYVNQKMTSGDVDEMGCFTMILCTHKEV